MNIDINSLTIGQVKELSAMFAGHSQQHVSHPTLTSMIGKKCIVRTYSAGCWFGEVAEKAGNEVILKNARRMWKWWAKESISLSAVALVGINPEKSKIAAPVPEVWLEAIELIPASTGAILSLEKAPVAQAE